MFSFRMINPCRDYTCFSLLRREKPAFRRFVSHLFRRHKCTCDVLTGVFLLSKNLSFLMVGE